MQGHQDGDRHGYPALPRMRMLHPYLPHDILLGVPAPFPLAPPVRVYTCQCGLVPRKSCRQPTARRDPLWAARQGPPLPLVPWEPHIGGRAVAQADLELQKVQNATTSPLGEWNHPSGPWWGRALMISEPGTSSSFCGSAVHILLAMPTGLHVSNLSACPLLFS